MKKTIVLIAYLVAFLTLSFTRDQVIFPYNSNVKMYDTLELLQLESGITPLSHNYPYTYGEIREILDSIDAGELNSYLSKMFNDINEYTTDYVFNNSFWDYSLEANLEGYFQTNSINNNWNYDFKNRKPLIEAGVSAAVGSIYLTTSLPIRRGLDFEYFTEEPVTNLSILWNLDQIDLQVPTLALTAIGGKNWNFSIGRDRLNYGQGKSGNFVLSNDSSFHDFARFSVFWKKFKYSSTILNIEVIDVPTLEKYGSDRIKMLIDHAIEIRPIDNLYISLHEAAVRGNTPLTLNYLNPIMNIHNLALIDYRLNPDQTVLGNSILTLGLGYTPISRLNIYGEFCLDQLETPVEAEKMGGEGTGDPNSFGYLFGVNYLLPLENMFLKFNAEYLYTNPHLYRSKYSWALYANTRYYHSLYRNVNDPIIEPLGHKEGPDTQLLMLGVKASALGDKLNINLNYELARKGEARINLKAETGQIAFAKETPTGIVSTINQINLGAEYKINKYFNVFTNLTGFIIENQNNIQGQNVQDFQIVLGSTFKL